MSATGLDNAVFLLPLLPFLVAGNLAARAARGCVHWTRRHSHDGFRPLNRNL